MKPGVTEIMLELMREEDAIQESEHWLDQKIFNDVHEEIYQRVSFTVCIIHAVANGRQYEGVGFSKARQEISASKYDPERGKSVAKGRAVHDLFCNYKKETKKSK